MTFDNDLKWQRRALLGVGVVLVIECGGFISRGEYYSGVACATWTMALLVSRSLSGSQQRTRDTMRAVKRELEELIEMRNKERGIE
jgi:hypothetical protein